MQKRFKVGFIGTGKIALEHAACVAHLGHEVAFGIASSPQSKNWEAFQKAYPQAKYLNNLEAFLENPEVDAIVVSLPWDKIEDNLLPLLSSPKPVLIEKPIALSSKNLGTILASPNVEPRLHNKRVGFNRRFYEPVQKLKNRLALGGLKLAEVHISEAVERLASRYGREIIPHLLHYSSSHTLDLMLYLFGPLEISQVRKAPEKKDIGFHSSISSLTTRNSVPISLTIVAENPLAMGIRCYFDDGTTWALSPLEQLTVSQEYEVTEPQAGSKIRKYIPKVIETTEAASDFKPGFLPQMGEFLTQAPSPIGATPLESYHLAKWIETLND